MPDKVDSSNWLESVARQLAAEKPVVVPELKIPEGFFGDQNQPILQDVVRLLPKIKDFKVVLDDKEQVINGHEYTLKPNPPGIFPGVWIMPKEIGLTRIFVSHYPNHSPEFGLDIQIQSEATCSSPLGATVGRIERYTEKGKFDNELRLLALPLGSFPIPEIDYEGEEILTVKTLTEALDAKIGTIPPAFKNEPNFEIGVGLQKNENAYPNNLLELHSAMKDGDNYFVQATKMAFAQVTNVDYDDLPKAGYPMVARLAEVYGGQLLGKNININERTNLLFELTLR